MFCFVFWTFRFKDITPQSLKKTCFHRFGICTQLLHSDFTLKFLFKFKSHKIEKNEKEMMFLRNVLFCLSGVSLQRYHSADFGLIKKTLFHTVSILAVLLLMTSRIMLLSLLLLSSVLLYGKTVWCFCMVISEVCTSDRISIFR